MAKCQNPLIKLVSIPAHVAIQGGMALLLDTRDAHVMRWKFGQMVERGVAKREQLADLKMKVALYETAIETNFAAALDIFRRVGLSEEHIMEYVADLQLEECWSALGEGGRT